MKLIYSIMIIGILNLQGAVSEHYDITKEASKLFNLDIIVKSVRYADEVAECDGIIISGGESTVIGKIIFERGIDKVIKEKNIPVFGTCAGMVLLAKEIDFNQPILGLMDIVVKRNAFGRQKDSFECELDILNTKYPGIFIRAPLLESYDKLNKNINVLCEFNGKIVAIQQNFNIAISFHPELTSNTLIHEYFIKQVINSKK